MIEQNDEQDFSKFASVDDYFAYHSESTRSQADWKLDGVVEGDADSLARKYVDNQRGGIMVDGIGQVSNVCEHARVYGIDPLEALVKVRDQVSSLGDRADEFQKRTMVNVSKALAVLEKNKPSE